MDPSELPRLLSCEPVFMGLGATVYVLDGLRFVVETTYPGDADTPSPRRGSPASPGTSGKTTSPRSRPSG